MDISGCYLSKRDEVEGGREFTGDTQWSVYSAREKRMALVLPGSIARGKTRKVKSLKMQNGWKGAKRTVREGKYLTRAQIQRKGN